MKTNRNTFIFLYEGVREGFITLKGGGNNERRRSFRLAFYFRLFNLSSPGPPCKVVIFEAAGFGA